MAYTRSTNNPLPLATSGLSTSAGISARKLAIAILFLTWAACVTYLSYDHAIWRDEMRALSLALQGDSVVAMLKSIHGEGHPAVWYLLLRAVHGVVNTAQALNVAALLVAFAGAGMFAFLSPFRAHVIAIFLFGGIAAFEFSVMARNYGISMLFLFLFAALYARKRTSGFGLGVVLFFLANCNAHSALLVMTLLAFWFVDLAIERNSVRKAASGHFLVNAGIAGAGIVVCFLTIYPTYNDAATAFAQQLGGMALLKNAVLRPGAAFIDLFPSYKALAGLYGARAEPFLVLLFSAVLYCSTLGLIRRPAAFGAALGALLGFSFFFNVVYPGSYRHVALWLTFLCAIYWIAGGKPGPDIAAAPATRPWVDKLARLGHAAFVLLLLLQLTVTGRELKRVVSDGPALSQSAALGKLIGSDPRLAQATILADPDYLVEALPYYVENKTFLMREQRYGNVVRFTKDARLDITLDDILDDAVKLRNGTGKPVLILLSQKLDSVSADITRAEGYNWKLRLTPEQARRFTGRTQLLARAAPTAGDESYDVYLLEE